jgi:aspartate aminotransferase
MSETKDCVVEEHLNENVRGLTPSATVAINDRSNLLRRQGKEIFKLGLGQSPFPVPDVVVESLREYAAEKDYLPVQGLEALRETVAEHHRRTFGIDCDAEDVLIGPGSKELMFLLQLVFYGDLLIPTPTWVSYAPQARIIGRPVQFVTTTSDDNWHLTPARLEVVCANDPERARLVILTYPSNPTGTTVPDDQLRELAQIARRKRVVLLERICAWLRAE